MDQFYSAGQWIRNKEFAAIRGRGRYQYSQHLASSWLGLGVRANITPNLVIKGEANFWDGFVFRLGIAGRF